MKDDLCEESADNRNMWVCITVNPEVIEKLTDELQQLDEDRFPVATSLAQGVIFRDLFDRFAEVSG